MAATDVDLHRHFEAGLSPETIARLAMRHGISQVRTRAGEVIAGTDPQDPDSIRRYYRDIAAGFATPAGFQAFADSFGLPLSVMRTLEDLEEAVFGQFVGLAEAGHLHTELRGSPFSYQEHVRASVDDIAAALLAGVDRAWRERQVSGTFILSFSRQKGQVQAPVIAELAARLHRADRPVGLDIAGFPEKTFPPGMFEAALRPARDAGVPITVHAGEQGRPPDFADAPPSLAVEAVERLGARRIGHGTSLVSSSAVQARLREGGIGIECCPVSNACMGFMPLGRHPLREFLANNLLVSVATDDPLMFGPFTVAETREMIGPVLGVTPTEWNRLARNALRTAFVSEERRAWLLGRLDEATGAPSGFTS